MKQAKHFISFFVIFCLFVTSCKVNYSFTGASIAPDIKTVSVQFFPNYAPLANPTLSQSFTEALKNIFISQTNLQLVNKGGDLNLEGAITNYYTSPIAIQGNDAAAMNRLTITVNVKFTNEKDEKQNFETSFSRYSNYSSTANLAAIEGELIKEINDQLAQDIFNKSVTNW